MPVTVKFDPQSVSKQAAVIPDATPANDGVMSKDQAAQLEGLVAAGGLSARVFKNLDNDVAAPSAPTPVTTGGATLALVVPAGATKLRLEVSQPILAVQPDGDPSAAGGGVAVLDGGTVFVSPGNDGLYSVTPGHTLSIFAAINNLYTGGTPYAVKKIQWGFIFTYSFT